jgi:tetratricopeptide (TPR) repeat protein
MSGDGVLEQAIALHRQGRPRDAVASLDGVVSVAPGRAEAWALRGQLLLEMGSWREALASFDRALAVWPSDAGTLALRGDALRLLGQPEAALAAYRAAAVVDLGHARALNGMGLIVTEQGQPRDGLALHDRVVALHPGFAEAHNGRGLALSRLDDLAGALDSFGRALAVWPDYVDALVNAGNTLRRMGRMEEALAQIQQALRLDPRSVDALYSQAGVLGALGRVDEAIALCDRALAVDPGFSHAILRRATLLALQSRHEEAVISFEQVLALSGKGAAVWVRAHVLRGDSLRGLDRLNEAVAAYDRAITLRPQFADAWLGRGLALRSLGDLDDAVDDFDTAVRLNPQHIEARLSRSALLATLGRNDESEAEARLILSIDPANGAAFNNLANALQRLGRMDEALGCFEAAIRLVPDPTAARFNYGMCLLQTGDFARGWREYEFRGKTDGWKIGWDLSGVPVWLGERAIAGQTILLYAEQGLGDTIQFCRYAPMVAALGARVVLGVPPVLKGLMRSLGEGVEVIDGDQPAPAFDMQCSIMSLPLAFRTDLASIPGRVPYLAAPEAYRAKWRTRLGERRGPRIGLAWSGNDKPLGRSIPLDAIGPLVGMLPEVFCLQRELRPSDVPALALCQGIRFFGHELADFSDTAALMQEMDLVVSIDTSVLHLAGALGRPAWGMMPFAADWRWLTERTDSPWYPTMRLFRPSASGDWAGIIDRVCAGLAVYLEGREWGSGRGQAR